MTHRELMERYCNMDAGRLMAAWEKAKTMYENVLYFWSLNQHLICDKHGDTEEDNVYEKLREEAKEAMRDIEVAWHAVSDASWAVTEAYWDRYAEIMAAISSKAKADAENCK